MSYLSWRLWQLRTWLGEDLPCVLLGHRYSERVWDRFGDMSRRPIRQASCSRCHAPLGIRR